MSSIDPRALRDAFGSFMTGVTIVTAVSKTGEKVGFTANSFTSVSMDPPLLLVCPANKLSSFEVFEQCEHFGVSILAEDQQHASNTFAGSKGDRFAEVDWFEDDYGTPLITGAVAHFSCSSFAKTPAGDHLMLVGKVEQFESNEKFGLGYAKGGYFSLGMEHKAEEVAHGQCARVGALIETNGKLLVEKTDKGYRLPAVDIMSEKGSRATLEGFMKSLGGDFEMGQVFSVYENTSTGNFTAFYRVERVDGPTPEHCEYVSLDALNDLTFTSSDLTTMVNRFVKEKQNGVFRLYVGNELEGDVR
ncbi:flavin reductase [Marinomonas piezotolerans]|uniref:Flavin reductase n=1 Tax=Marinomonas piezotolerans TaxID=2213058 RepID=A0A370UCR6_9GAMM|nr:flavin reductase family protein [Marinomonas piezotolerans]RDL45578.1 flavin reductase [Marinomonas piezotolerans]